MSRFVTVRKIRLGTFDDEGEIAIAVESIVAMEAACGTGGQATTITLPGGRQVHVKADYEEFRTAILHAVKP